MFRVMITYKNKTPKYQPGEGVNKYIYGNVKNHSVIENMANPQQDHSNANIQETIVT